MIEGRADELEALEALALDHVALAVAILEGGREEPAHVTRALVAATLANQARLAMIMIVLEELHATVRRRAV